MTPAPAAAEKNTKNAVAKTSEIRHAYIVFRISEFVRHSGVADFRFAPARTQRVK